MNTRLQLREVRAEIPQALTIRFAAEQDERAVIRLAAFDSARVPRGLLLLAEERGELRAALSLTDGSAIADPFRGTAHLVEMLRLAARGSTARSGRA